MKRDTHGTRARLEYQEQDSAQTLADGLEEYYAANVGTVTRPRDLPPESAALFRSHDICHVIFGLNTSLTDEALADTRALLSSDVGYRRYVSYLRTNAEAQAIFKRVGYVRSMWITLLATPRILRAVVASWEMRTNWPWETPEAFQCRSLYELRVEFSIRVI